MAAIQQFAKQQIIFSLLFLFSGSLVFSQTTLSLASGSAAPGGSVSLNLSLTATTAPAGLQWMLSYSPQNVASLSVAAGPALIATSKTLNCKATTGSTTCLAVGMNSKTIGSGIVAVVSVTLPSISSLSVPLSVVNTFGALLDGTATVGSGTGGTITVQLQPGPLPSITSLSPSSATAGGAAFTLTVNGSGFVSGSVVNWNGSARTTTLVSATQLQAAISATDIATAGTAQVTVFNLAPGGGTSGHSAFNINNPVPASTSLSPSSATAGGAAFTLTVKGTGFMGGSVVNWNGTGRTTTFVSATQLQATILGTDIAPAATAQVTVVNPAPGGGTSGNSPFSILATNRVPTISQIAVFRPTSAAPNSLDEWVEDSDGNNVFETTDKVRIFGLSGLPGTTLPDVAVAGDFFGTGSSEIGVFRCPAIGQPGVCQWYIDANNNGQWDGLFGGDAIWSFGLPGDIPVVGDWTGSGTAKIGVVRCPAAGVCTWYLDIGNRHVYDPATVGTHLFGLPGDKPVVSNWSGIAQNAPVDNIGVFRCPASGVCTWIVESAGVTGLSTLVPVDAFSPSDAQYSFGLSGDIPVVGNWNGTGQKRIGVFRPNSPEAGLAQWFVDTNGDHIFELAIDQIFSYGLAGDQPVVGLFAH